MNAAGPRAHDSWTLARGSVLASAGEVHVWRLDLAHAAAAAERLWSRLSADEQTRAASFAFTRDRVRFVAARAGLRQLLGHALGRDGARLAFATNRFGKPRLADGGRLAFNVSHSADRAVYALALDREVGIDVEAIRAGFLAEADPAHFFAPRELAELRRAPAAEQTDRFFAGWSRKEAYMKARGLGLSKPLDRFAVSLAPADAALLEDRDDAAAVARWTLAPLAIAPGYSGALCADGPFTLRLGDLLLE
ncbi:MAG TPA: 4'-phosphopantetheinyl transferase superfamily protein [Polyangia bacterium]|nr:4'-phosphopantetheinyl transferase superfamily protein [Polyangia bacterium]